MGNAINLQGRPHIWGHGEMSSPCFRPLLTENYMVVIQQFAAIKQYSIYVLTMFKELRVLLLIYHISSQQII